MKKQIFTLLLCALFSTVMMAQVDPVVIKKTTELPLIDGVIDAVWDAAPQNDMTTNFRLEEPTLGSLGETWWKGLWTDDGVYILVNITDDAFLPSYKAGGNSWDFDKIELYFDCGVPLIDGQSAHSSGHYQIAPEYKATNVSGELTVQLDDAVEYAFLLTDPNMVAEYYVPMSKLKDKAGIQISQTAQIGFDVTICDRDGDEITPTPAARQRLNWANTGGTSDDGGTTWSGKESWDSMDGAGIFTLEGGVDNIPAEGIVLTSENDATTITTEAGTLQFTATVSPASATVQTVGWTVDNGTGKATISSTGLLTAVKDGLVTVIATTLDGTAIEEYIDVTISNQFISKSDVDLIKNGNFSLYNAAKYPTFWEGWTEASAPCTIVDGVSVHTVVDSAVGAPQIWAYQFMQKNFTPVNNADYILTFDAWADANRTIVCHFEDVPNNYNRYVSSTDANAVNGRGEWNIDLTTAPTKFTLHLNFDQVKANTANQFGFFLGQWSVFSTVYIDNVSLISVDDLNTAIGIEIAEITVKSAGDATAITTDKGTLQMSADLLPVDAGYPYFTWSVVNGTGMATISADGLLSAFDNGTVTVVATAKDGSGVVASKEITLSNQKVQVVNLDTNGKGFVKGDRVFISGAAWNWPEPGKNANLELFDKDGDGIFTIKLAICPNMWSFKFFKNVGWGGGESISSDRLHVFASSETLDNTWGVRPADVTGVNPFPATFESANDMLWSTFSLGSKPFECSNFAIVSNPDVAGINSSANCLQFVVDPTSDPWVGAYSNAYLPLNFTADFHTLTMMVYKTEISPSGLKVEASTNGGPTTELKVSNTKTNEWELLTFDFSACVGFSYPRWVFFPDFPASRTGGSTVLLDNIGGGGPNAVSSKNANNVKVYPNPVTNELNVTFTSPNAKVTIYNSLGRTMEEVIVKETKATFDVSQYARGLYFVKVNNDTLVKFVK